MNSCIYIHIPFCIKKCIYCDFLSISYNSDLAAKYITALSNEINLRKSNATIKTIYIGGGTPTTLAPFELTRLLKNMRASFDIYPDAEITIEANPGTVDREKILTLKGSGVNRFSLGIQSFNDKELRLLDRIHSASDGIRAIELIRECKIENLSLDLIYGLPGQTLNDWAGTIAKTIELSPEHISAYELTPEKDTPLYNAITQGKLSKPDEDTIVEMYYLAIEALADAGYRQYEISNFAKKGFESRHNTNYWDRGEYTGLGAGAHSFIEGRRIKNTSDIGKYITLLNTGNLAIEETTEVSCEDAIKEFIFLGLRKTEGLDIANLKDDLGIDILAVSDGLIDEGFLEYNNNRLKLTFKGIVISNSVIINLFEKLKLN